ncbi:helix-turn-helix domain-containing protein [Pseudonocardia sp.]|uniref:helix-turn-helix domain-containing protein n=1 Tax=Pseudonocardia sp. TaxID=60912 RepID=UPI0031FC5418
MALELRLEQHLDWPLNRPLTFDPAMDLTTPKGRSWLRILRLANREAREHGLLDLMRYLREVRMRKVREDLLGATLDVTTVGAIVYRWGILNQGRFAGDYRKTFRETPSETCAGIWASLPDSLPALAAEPGPRPPSQGLARLSRPGRT